MGTGSFFHGYSSRGAALAIHPHLAARLKNYTSSPHLGLHGLFYSEVYFYLSPYCNVL